MTKILTLKEMHKYGEELAEQVAKEMESEPQRAWKSLTSAQMKALWVAAEKKPSVFAGMIDAKLKELNHDTV